MRNVGLDETQAGIKIAWRNINNLIYAEYIMQNAGLDEAQAGIRLCGEISITTDMQITPSL